MEYQRASAATSFTKKPSNGHSNSFNGKNLYDGVFSGQTKKGSRVEDYAEIFGGNSSASSIPFLDVPELNQRKFSVNVSSSKLDYSSIFGDSHFADEFVPKPIGDQKRPAKSASFSEVSFSNGNQVLSNDGVKQFKMSYNKSSPVSKNGTNGTIHVAVPSYTCVVDEKVAPHREKLVSSVVNKPPYGNSKFGEEKRDGNGIHCEKPVSDVQPCGAGSERTSKGVDRLDGEIKSNGSDCNDVLFGSFDFGRITPPTKVTRASTMSYGKGVNKRDSLKFGVSRSQSLDCDAGVSSPPYFDDEVDVNSVAATSAAAVTKAIEEAQARLKVAKEIMDRRKCHMGRVKPSFNGSSRGEERKKDKDSVKQNNFREDKAQESSEKIIASMQTSDGLKMQNVVKVRQVANKSEDGERGSIAREVAGETCANNFVSSQADCRQEVGKRESAKEGEKEKGLNQYLSKHEGEEHKIIERPEVIGEATEQERKLDASKEFCVKEECLHKHMPHVEFHDPKEDETRLRFGELWEETEEKMCNELETCEKKLKNPEKPLEDERKVEMQELKHTYNVERPRVYQEMVDMEDKHKHMIEVEENGYALKDVSEKEVSEMLLQENSTHKKFNKISEEAFEISETKEEHKVTCGPQESNEEEDACKREDNEQMSDKMEPEIIDRRDNACDHEEEMRKLEEIGDSLGNEEFVEAEDNGDLLEDAYQMEAADEVPKDTFESTGTEEVQKHTVQEADEMTEAREDALDGYWEDLEVADDVYNDDKSNDLGQNSEPSSNVDSCEMTPELLNEEKGGIAEGCEAYSECKETRIDSEVASDLEESLAFDKSDLAESNLKPNEIKQQAENTRDAFNLDSSIDIDTADITFEKDQYEQYSEKSEKIFTMEKHVEELACESEDVREGEFSLKQEENKNDFEHSDEVRLVDSRSHCEFGEKHEATQIAHEIEAGQSTEYEEKSCPQTLMKEERETKNVSQEEVKLVNEEQKRVEEAGRSTEYKEESCPQTLMKEDRETKNASQEEVKLVNEEQRRVDEAGQSTEYEEESCPQTLTKEEREAKNVSQEEVKLVNEEQRRVDEAGQSTEYEEESCPQTWTKEEREARNVSQEEVKLVNEEQRRVDEAGQCTEYEEKSCPRNLMKEERETKNASQEEVKLVNEEQKRVDEAKEMERQRGKEKQKERIAVERAIREARERAFAEARERAAAGRANIEAQRKVKAQAQGESTKPSAEANDKTFMEAKLKAERAAVERATAEARQRALEKSFSEKASLGARNQASQSYDSRQKGSCPPTTSKYQTSSNQSASKYSEGLDGAAGESAQRCKARLERNQRTSERAAKALAEKNERDLLAQKEQTERNRLAETLDAEVKRWSSGKQGNLRALLSTLQYILGPDSGWQAIPLTDIIATAAVKKAYRKATLCVHPDKLQQRGATIQQKYICEKVFDLLKEAWNRFSAEER